MPITITLSRYTHHDDGTTHSAVLLNGQPVTREFVNDHETAERYARELFHYHTGETVLELWDGNKGEYGEYTRLDWHD